MNQEVQELAEQLQGQLAAAQQQVAHLKQQPEQQQPEKGEQQQGDSSSALVADLKQQLASAQQSAKAQAHKLSEQHQEVITALEEELEQVGGQGSEAPWVLLQVLLLAGCWL